VERRLLTFIVASTAFFLSYIWLRSIFVPPPPPVPPPAAVAEVDDPLAPDLAAALDQQAADDQVSPSDTAVSAASAGDEPQPGTPPTEGEQPNRPEQPEWLTLGSMDPASGFQMLVTLCSRGAGVQRIELTERDETGHLKYRRIDVFSGYLGHFAGLPASDRDGVRVNVVGPGTPAAIAGIAVGDVITAVAGVPVAFSSDIEAALRTTRPGDTISLEVVRPGASSPTALQATLTEHPLDVLRLSKDGGVDEIAGNETRLSCLMTLSQINRKSILTDARSIDGLNDPSELIWNVIQNSVVDGPAAAIAQAEFDVELTAAEMKAVGGHPIRFRHSYQLLPNSYSLDMAVQVENLADQPQDLAYRLEGPNGITLEGWWYSTKISPNFSGAAARDVIYKTAADGHQLISGFNLLKHARADETDPHLTIFAPDAAPAAKDMKYIGVDAQYFLVGFVPASDDAALTQFRRASATIAADPTAVIRHTERAINSTFFVDSNIETVPAGGSIRHELRLFAGPKQPEVLAKYGLQDAIYYGWFAGFARILAGMLHAFSGVGNYAVAIILLTLLVRALMFPLSRKAAINAQKMQELAPEMKKISEKYKDDMEGKLKAQRELQQRVGFNPLAGCLPMFLQLPIFIGLYRALSVDIELRQAAVWRGIDWASNLAAPDMFAYWGDWLMDYLSGRGTGWLGPFFNILPVIVVVLFLAQQKMFMPPATDEQTRLTQKMMNIMTLMMGLFFFRVPAGLCIYFITSSLWGICERVLVKKTLPEGKHFDLDLAIEGAPAKEGKSQSLADRIRSQVVKPVEPTVPPNKRKRPPSKKK
jgi:YidC/Oxa1 family membrane protein insertase